MLHFTWGTSIVRTVDNKVLKNTKAEHVHTIYISKRWLYNCTELHLYMCLILLLNMTYENGSSLPFYERTKTNSKLKRITGFFLTTGESVSMVPPPISIGIKITAFGIRNIYILSKWHWKNYLGKLSKHHFFISKMGM